MNSMQRRGWRTTGTEPSAAAAASTRMATGASVFSTIADPALDDEGPFEVVTLWSVLEHAHDPRATLRRLRSLLTPNGHLVGVVPNFQSIERKVFGRDWFALDIPRHLQHFGATSLVRILTASGFEVIEVRHTSGHDNLRWSIQRRLGKHHAAENPAVAPDRSSATALRRTVSRSRGVAVQWLTSSADRLTRGQPTHLRCASVPWKPDHEQSLNHCGLGRRASFGSEPRSRATPRRPRHRGTAPRGPPAEGHRLRRRTAWLRVVSRGPSADMHSRSGSV